MKKIVIYDTALGTSNIGDEIILDAIYKNMAEIFAQGTALRFATHVENFNPVQMLRRSMKVKYCQEADWKFVCGTNLFSQRMLGKINSQWQLKLHNKSIYNNCILIGVGATSGGENMDFWAKYLYKSVISKEYTHSVRDDMTKRMMESLGLKAINTGCPTLWKLSEDFCRTIPTSKSDNCIFTVSGYVEQKDPVSDQLLIDILKSNYKKLWVWIQTTEDDAYLSSLKGTENIERIYSLDEYHRILVENDTDYIGTRLHGGVYAMQHAKRSIVVSIDHRAEGFHETNNLPIITRSDIASHLENRINEDFKTEIILDQNAINKFKSQFC